jgi:hypothetical protein
MAIGPSGRLSKLNRPDSSLVVENVSDPTLAVTTAPGTGFPPETTEPPQPDCANATNPFSINQKTTNLKITRTFYGIDVFAQSEITL